MLVVIEPPQAGAGTPFADRFRHLEVEIGTAGHLRQVGHDQDLAILRQALELTAEDGGFGTADAGVDLVKDPGGRGSCPRPPVPRR